MQRRVFNNVLLALASKDFEDTVQERIGKDMKIRIKIPDNMLGDNPAIARFTDDVLLWAMEVEMDVDLYSIQYLPAVRTYWSEKRTGWAVFTVEPDSEFMFCLKYGALQHKGKKKHEEV